MLARFLSYCTLLILYFDGFAQKGFVQLQLHKGNTVVHTTAVKNIAGAQPIAIELLSGKQKKYGNYLYNNGWSLQYTNYGSGIVGNSVVLARFIEPQFVLAPSIHGSLKSSFGIAYLNSPNTGTARVDNQNYALYINPYLHIGIGLDGKINQQLRWTIQGNFHHISNGNLQQPNKGLNWVTAAIGMRYYYTKINPTNPSNTTATTPKLWQEVGLQFVPQQGYFAKWKGQRNWLIGAQYQWWKPMTDINALGLGAEVQYQKFTMDKEATPIHSPWVVGVHAGHSFLLGKVHFSQQVGYSIINPLYFLPSLYHRWGIDYAIQSHLRIGANLKANSDNADFFDLRLSYQW